jgi:hypothetical protein
MAKRVRVTIEYDVPNSATLVTEQPRIQDVARTFIAHSYGEYAKVVAIEFTNKAK